MKTSRPAQTSTGRVSFSSALLVLLLFAGAFVAGCTIRLIGDYDDTIDKGITDVQQRAESYFSTLSSNPSAPCNQGFHDDMRARLVVLQTRASSLPKYSIISDQIGLLKKTFADFQTVDCGTPRPLKNDPNTNKPPLVSNTESAVTVSVESILKIELALKRGDAPAAAKQ